MAASELPRATGMQVGGNPSPAAKDVGSSSVYMPEARHISPKTKIVAAAGDGIAVWSGSGLSRLWFCCWGRDVVVWRRKKARAAAACDSGAQCYPNPLKYRGGTVFVLPILVSSVGLGNIVKQPLRKKSRHD